MLGERDYIKNRQVKNLELLKVFLLVSVLVNLAVFVSAGKLWGVLALDVEGLSKLYLWKLATAFFLAAPNGLIAFIFDILIFYYAGKRLEESYHEAKVRQIFKVILFALLVCAPPLLLFFSHQSFYFFSSFMLGVVCAYSWYFYEISTRFYIFFVLPVDLKGKHILILISLYGLLTAWTQSIHLLIQFSVVFISIWLLCKKPQLFNKKHKKKKHKPKSPKKRTEIQQGFRRHVREDLADPEIDAILDKILAEGIESLSAEEKKTLESRKNEP